jgi:prefoldin subunit 5
MSSSPVFDAARSDAERLTNRIAALRAEIIDAERELGDVQAFIEMYQRYARAVAAEQQSGGEQPT